MYSILYDKPGDDEDDDDDRDEHRPGEGEPPEIYGRDGVPYPPAREFAAMGFVQHCNLLTRPIATSQGIVTGFSADGSKSSVPWQPEMPREIRRTYKDALDCLSRYFRSGGE